MIAINLLPWREARRQKDKKFFMYLLLAALILAATFIFIIEQYASNLISAENNRNQKIKDEIILLDKKLTEIRTLKKQRDNLILRMNIVHGLQEKRQLTLHLFDELIKVLPDGIYLSEVSRKDELITLKGYSQSNTFISTLMNNIQNNPWLTEPDLIEIKKSVETTNPENKTPSVEKDVSYSFILHFLLKNTITSSTKNSVAILPVKK